MASEARTLNAPLWMPSAERRAESQLYAFARRVGNTRNVDALKPDGTLDYEALHAWSIGHPRAFWTEVWRFCGVVADPRPEQPDWDEVLIGDDRVAPPDASLGPRWFRDARLNFAENLLRFREEREALVSWGESGRRTALTFRQLHEAVARVAVALKAAGVKQGDRVAGFLPNIPEAVIAMLATASMGAVWSSCSADFGVNGVLDRFGQIEPKVLIAADGYTYAGKPIDTLERVRSVAAALPRLERLVLVPFLRSEDEVADAAEAMNLTRVAPAVLWTQWTAAAGHGNGGSPLEFARLPFEHPLFIMYSSGTTGLPKCMVHGAGGTLLQHQKEHVLHTDLSSRDRIFYFTT
ncbi:MAG: AMP-binding protein, partial [Gemmatimonadaceae bacterium]